MVELRRRGDWPFAAPPAAAPRHDERFNVAEARTINLTGDLTTSGILVTSAVGNNVSTITGGNLTGPTSSDLVVIQNNPSNVLTIGSTIINNTTTNLTKAGAGTLELTATNSYTGPTTVTGGVLKLTSSALGLPGGIAFAGGSSNLTLKGGVLGLMSDFPGDSGPPSIRFSLPATGDLPPTARIARLTSAQRRPGPPAALCRLGSLYC